MSRVFGCDLKQLGVPQGQKRGDPLLERMQEPLLSPAPVCTHSGQQGRWFQLLLDRFLELSRVSGSETEAVYGLMGKLAKNR